MLERIINIDINKNIIDFTADYILASNKKIAVVSGGRRPFLFIKRKLAQMRSKAFFPPIFYTNDEFIEQFVFKKFGLVKIPDIEAAYMIYKIVKDETPCLLKGDHSFASFLDWSQEIFSFIEQLDLEDVSDEKLKTVKVNAEIGYDVPENINSLLKNIFKIRESFHKYLDESCITTKGFSFLKVAKLDCCDISENIDEIILLAPFYLRKTEIKIFKNIYNTGNLTLIVQGNPNDYSVLENLYREFGQTCPSVKTQKNNYELNIYSAVDDQSQGCCLKNLISSFSKDELNRTVVVVPDLKMLQSLLSEISTVTDKYNVSAGYPADITAVFSLINEIIEAQISKREEYYHSRDFIRILTNPLFKNMKFAGESAISKIVSHKVEDALRQGSNSYLSGKMFVSFKEIIGDKKLIVDIQKDIEEIYKYLPYEEVVNILNEIFEVFFEAWSKIETFSDLSVVLFDFLNELYVMSVIEKYPLNIEAMDILLSLSKEMKYGEVAKVKFYNGDIFRVFKKLIKDKRIFLPGSPLEGLQILGFLESRNLFFDNVFIVGMTDSVIPVLKKDYSLVPKDIMYALGIEMTGKEYEIQKYHFNRLIAGAKKLNLIYPDNDKNERSRFIESIIWEKQFEAKDLNAVKINKFVLQKISVKKILKRKYEKTKKIKKYLRNIPYTYSKIDSYLTCRLKFYFQYVLCIDNKAEIGDELSEGDVGNFVHDFLKDTFHENLELKEIQTKEFKEFFFRKLNVKFNSSSCFGFREDSFLIKEVFNRRMERILKKEIQREFKSIYACEKKYNSNIQTNCGQKYKLSCKIDRIDTDGKEYMILDYKTGYIPENIISISKNNFNNLQFNRHDIKRTIKSLQLPLYKYIFEKETALKVSQCSFYNIKSAEILDFPLQQDIYEKCIDVIKYLLDEINSDDYFIFDKDDEHNCKTCKYFYLCK